YPRHGDSITAACEEQMLLPRVGDRFAVAAAVACGVVRPERGTGKRRQLAARVVEAKDLVRSAVVVQIEEGGLWGGADGAEQGFRTQGQQRPHCPTDPPGPIHHLFLLAPLSSHIRARTACKPGLAAAARALHHAPARP